MKTKGNNSDMSPKKQYIDRRKFIKRAGAALALSIAVKIGLQISSGTKAVHAHTSTVPSALSTFDWGKTDVLIRMQEELKLAMEKPPDLRHWHMVIDLRKCVGCLACTVACVAENKLPPGVVYRPVLEEEIGIYPNVTRRFIPRPCMQCHNPPCVPVCPVGATWTQPDGTVVIDYHRCIGCRYCVTACPYSARTHDFGEMYTAGTPKGGSLVIGQEQSASYERLSNNEYAGNWPRINKKASPTGNVRKCHFCQHRLENGILPACVTTCIGRATYFGDASNPDSLVTRLAAQHNVIRLKDELGTEPSVYYLI